MTNHRRFIKKCARKQNIPIKVKKGKWKNSWKIELLSLATNTREDTFMILYNYLVLKGYYAKHIPLKNPSELTIAVNKELTTEVEVWFYDVPNDAMKLVGKVMINPKDISNECERIFGSLQNVDYSHPFRTRSMYIGDYIALPDGTCYIVDQQGWIKSKLLTLEEFTKKFHPSEVWIYSFASAELSKSNIVMAYSLLDNAIKSHADDIPVTPEQVKHFMPTKEEFYLYWVNQNLIWW